MAAAKGPPEPVRVDTNSVLENWLGDGRGGDFKVVYLGCRRTENRMFFQINVCVNRVRIPRAGIRRNGSS